MYYSLCTALLYYLLTPCVTPCYSTSTVILTRILELIYPPACLSCHTRVPAAGVLELCADCER